MEKFPFLKDFNYAAENILRRTYITAHMHLKRWQRFSVPAFYLFLFLLVFLTITSDTSGRHWGTISFATGSYSYSSLKSPWDNVRTPGFALCLRLIGAGKSLRNFKENNRFTDSSGLNKLNQRIASDAFINSSFRNLRLANTGFLALGLTFMCFALGRGLPPVGKWPWFRRMSAAALVLFCVRWGRLVPMGYVMADTLALIITPFAMGCLLLFFQNHKFRIYQRQNSACSWLLPSRSTVLVCAFWPLLPPVCRTFH